MFSTSMYTPTYNPYIHSQNISTQDQQSSTSTNVLQMTPAIVEGCCTGQSLTPANILQMTPAIAGEYGTVRQSSTSADVLQMTPAIAGECCIECCPVAAAEAAQAAITMQDSGPNRDSESNNTDYTANEPRHSSFLWTAQDLQHGCKWQGCYLRFETYEELTGHVSEGHIGCGRSQYVCYWERCDRNGRPFSQRQKVMRHIQTHTGDKPYQCTICKKRFSEANIMTQHMRTHTGERPFKCPQPNCDREFSISGALTIHLRVHTGEKPFKCKQEGCVKRFAESSNLTKHMRVHTGERPFQCPVVTCKKKFSRSDQVTRHRKTHSRQGRLDG